jgi:hypothetical protein
MNCPPRRRRSRLDSQNKLKKREDFSSRLFVFAD